SGGAAGGGRGRGGGGGRGPGAGRAGAGVGVSWRCEPSDPSGPQWEPQGGWGWGPAPEATETRDPASREASIGNCRRCGSGDQAPRTGGHMAIIRIYTGSDGQSHFEESAPRLTARVDQS